MGTNCDPKVPPQYHNRCSQNVGEIYHMDGFCTLVGNTGTRREYCARMSSAGEWTYDSASGGCSYNDCDEVTDWGSGCCRFCCGIAGLGVNCRRVAFKGSPVLCCLHDLACNPTDPNACFDDSSHQQTCDPKYRSQSSPDCRAAMLQYCTGYRPDGTKESTGVWVQRWLGDVKEPTPDGKTETFSRPCYHAVYRNLYDKQPGACLAIPDVGIPDPAGYIYAQDLMSAMIARYGEDGGRLDVRESGQGNDQLNSLIWQICSTNPGLCQRALYRYCANTTVDTLTRNPSILPWCGCYMPPEQYAKYTDLYQISRECTPTCNIKGVVPLPSDTGVGTKTCKQTTCVIDDISIAIAQSQVSGGISFSQLCSSCQAAIEGSGTGTCQCVITGGTFRIIDAQIGNISVSQQCGANATCYQQVTRPDGTMQTIKVPCDAQTDYNPYAEVERQEAINRTAAMSLRNLKIALVFLLVLVIIIILWFALRPSMTGLPRPSPKVRTST